MSYFSASIKIEYFHCMNTLKLEEDFNIPSSYTKLTLNDYPDIKLFIKRDDLIHPAISGNKWRKLKQTLFYFLANDYTNLVTFGGPFSNHILATAVACSKLSINCHAFIRTDKLDLENPTLILCKKFGMKLYPMSRADYKIKSSDTISNHIKSILPNTLIIPEGGSSKMAITGMQEMIREIKSQIPEEIDHYFCSLGTSATAVGIASAITPNSQLTISPAIKGFDLETFKEKYHEFTLDKYIAKNVSISYHPLDRAYAKKDMTLFKFAEDFLIQYGILLDPIYTSKVMRKLFSYLENQAQSENICVIHSGGIQAWNGYFYRSPQLKKELPNIFKYMEEFNKKLGF